MPLLLGNNKYRPRTCVNIRVGKYHTLSVVLHLRSTDWAWYLQNAADITTEFQELLQERVLPRMFGAEIEEFIKSKHPTVILPPESNEYGDGTGKLASKNKSTKQGNKVTRGETGSGKRTGKGKSTNIKNNTAKSNERKKRPDSHGGHDEKPEKDVYYSFGELIQLSYRREEPGTSASSNYRAIFFRSRHKQEDHQVISAESITKQRKEELQPFSEYRQLSHRLLIWISKIDIDQKTNPDPVGVGFYRPEMIPISHLFRRPSADLLLERECLEEEKD